MFIGVGVGAYWAGVYHLMTHAFFKACLFLGSGSVILGCHHEQDMRKMGGLKKYMPITRWTYLFACIAIAGFPIANGFYSKDEILWKAFTRRHLALFGVPTPWLGPLIWVVGIVAATGTAFYMFRSYYMTFTGEYRGGAGHHDEHNVDPHSAVAAKASAHTHAVHADDGAAHAWGAARARTARTPTVGDAAAAHGHERTRRTGTTPATPRRRTTTTTRTAMATTAARRTSRPGPSRSCSLLAVGSFVTLFLGIPVAWTHTAPLLEHWLEPALLAAPFAHVAHVWEYVFQGVGVLAATVGWLGARALYKDARSEVPARLKARFEAAWTVVYNKYYVDELYDLVVVRPSVALARTFGRFDGSVIDGMVNFVGAVGRTLGRLDAAIDKYLVDGLVNAWRRDLGLRPPLRQLQTGRIQTYLYGALGGALVVVLLNFLIP